MTSLAELKKSVFHEMLGISGRVFLVAKYSENAMIGTRGFTEDEMKNGIVLVFNSRMNFSWDESGITSTLMFGASPQKCFIPVDDIVVVYSPELNAQFVTAPLSAQAKPDVKAEKQDPEEGKKNSGDSKVVKIDFQKKKR